MKLETVIVDEHAANILEEAKNRFHAAAEAEGEQRQKFHSAVNACLDGLPHRFHAAPVTGDCVAATTHGEDGAVTGFITVHTEVTELKSAEQQIADQLQDLGDSVRRDDVLSRLKTISDDAVRQQRDRREGASREGEEGAGK